MTVTEHRELLLERVAEILDEYFAPMAKAADRGDSDGIVMSDVQPMAHCLSKLMEAWFLLRPESSEVGAMKLKAVLDAATTGSGRRRTAKP